MDGERNSDALQSTFDELAHLLIDPSRLSTLDNSEIGVGGYGEVCLAKLDRSLTVAVKELRITQAKGTRDRIAKRLAREAKVWATAKHPNVLELVGYSLSENYVRAQLISPYMRNGNVTEYIKRTQADIEVRLGLVRGITSGIEYLHTCSPPICHGDLKPANVLISDEPNAVLCDFGLATFVEGSDTSSGLTTSRSIKGSTRYMSPELFLDTEAKHTLDSDVWAWGCTIFEIITDCIPFYSCQSNGSIMFAIVQGQPPGLITSLPNVDIPLRPTLDALQRLIPNCWSKDPGQRPPSSHILKQLNRAHSLPKPGDIRLISPPTRPPEVTQAAPEGLQRVSSASGVFQWLVRSYKAVLKRKPTTMETRVQPKHGLASSVGKRSQGVKRDFIVLVFIRYTGWYYRNEDSLQLDSVLNDLGNVLHYLRYRHDDEERMWHLLTDMDLEYTDEAGDTKVLQRTNPTREAILNTLTEAGKTGGSGLVYFGGFGEYGPPGTSVLKQSDGKTHYAVNEVNESQRAESRSSFIIAIDGGRISGEDIFSRLPEDVGTECIHTVVLDTSHSAGLARAARGLRHRYGGVQRSSGAESLEVPAEATNAERRSSKQLVIISATREGEIAGSVRLGSAALEYGALTWFLLDWLKKYPYATTQNVAERLHYRCALQAPEGRKQHPEILARHHLTDSFELLPGLLRRSVDENTAAGRPYRLLGLAFGRKR